MIIEHIGGCEDSGISDSYKDFQELSLKELYLLYGVKLYPYCPTCIEEAKFYYKSYLNCMGYHLDSHYYKATETHINIEEFVNKCNEDLFNIFCKKTTIFKGILVLFVIFLVILFSLVKSDTIYSIALTVGLLILMFPLVRYKIARYLFNRAIDKYYANVKPKTMTNIIQFEVILDKIRTSREFEEKKEIIKILEHVLDYIKSIDTSEGNKIAKEYIPFLDNIYIVVNQSKYESDYREIREVMKNHIEILYCMNDNLQNSKELDFKTKLKLIKDESNEIRNFIRLKKN